MVKANPECPAADRELKLSAAPGAPLGRLPPSKSTPIGSEVERAPGAAFLHFNFTRASAVGASALSGRGSAYRLLFSLRVAHL